jgi:hypothetical protein
MTIVEQLKALVAKQRLYASFFKGGTKPQEELAVVSRLLESMAAHGEARFLEPSVSAVDLPDCVAKTSDGTWVAIEVTELVCEEAVRINAKRDRHAIKRMEPRVEVMRRWDQRDFIGHISSRLRDKDAKHLKGGPYGHYVVALHTDEPELERDECERWLRDHTFGPLRQIHEAYLLFSYAAGAGYPSAT